MLSRFDQNAFATFSTTTIASLRFSHFLQKGPPRDQQNGTARSSWRVQQIFGQIECRQPCPSRFCHANNRNFIALRCGALHCGLLRKHCTNKYYNEDMGGMLNAEQPLLYFIVYYFFFIVGRGVGLGVGALVGFFVIIGFLVGLGVRALVGFFIGAFVGFLVGFMGFLVGWTVGFFVGWTVGFFVGLWSSSSSPNTRVPTCTSSITMPCFLTPAISLTAVPCKASSASATMSKSVVTKSTRNGFIWP